ncbi:MAG TPA: (2Fe-2S)-binding protein [Candidatus Limnocylindrales bacterium]|nr:(2Fe-2S)-binding protein [Candidatus Limnocylindrales bacterium]
MKHPVRLTVNGVTYEREVEPRTSLADFLREDLDLTGTHLGCEHGVCGACTVLLDGEPVRSCLMLAVQAADLAVTTIEGLAAAGSGLAAAGEGDLGVDGPLHPIQEAFRAHHGLQCGFCTPGIVLTAQAFLRENPSPTPEQIREAIAGNLCRCTGYHFIVEAISAAAEALRAATPVRS